MDEPQEKCVVESDSKEKMGNTIDQLDLLHTPFIDPGDYGGSSRALGIRDDLLVGYGGGWKTHHRSCRGLRKRMWR